MINLLIVPVVILAGVFLLIKYLEHTSVFFPGKLIQSTPDMAGVPYEDLYITTSDGVKINAWFAKHASAAPTIIFAHGNAGTMGERVMKFKYLFDMGFNVILFDYRGYARSEGKPTEKGIYLDAQAVYDYLSARTDIDHNRMIGYGASLGGVVIIDLATKRKLAAILVESSFTSAKDMAHRLYPMLPAWMMGIKFDSISKVKDLKMPKLFMHGPDDHTVPFAMGQKLFEAAAEPKAFVSLYGGHNDGGLTDTRVRADFKKFLDKYSLL